MTTVRTEADVQELTGRKTATETNKADNHSFSINHIQTRGRILLQLNPNVNRNLIAINASHTGRKMNVVSHNRREYHFPLIMFRNRIMMN